MSGWARRRRRLGWVYGANDCLNKGEKRGRPFPFELAAVDGSVLPDWLGVSGTCGAQRPQDCLINNAHAAAVALAAAAMTIDTPKALESAGPFAPSTGPSSAVAIRPPVRATALFSPDADPT